MHAKVLSDAARVLSSQFYEGDYSSNSKLFHFEVKLSEYLSESSIRPYFNIFKVEFFFNTFLFNARKNKISNNLFQNFKVTLISPCHLLLKL